MLVPGLENLLLFKMISGDKKCLHVYQKLCECAQDMLAKYQQKQELCTKLTIKTEATTKLLCALCEAPKGQREIRETILSALKSHAEVLQGYEHLLSEKGNTYALIKQTQALRDSHDYTTVSLLRYHELKNKCLAPDTLLDDEQKKVLSELAEKKDLTLKMLEAIHKYPPVNFASVNMEFMVKLKMMGVRKRAFRDRTFQFPGILGAPGVPANVPEGMSTDIKIAMQKTGYHPDEKGVCYGIAWTALLACVRQDGQAYMKRIQYLKRMCVPPLRRADAYQVYHFFDTVTLAQTNYTDMSGYSKGIGYPGRQEVAFPGRVIASHWPGYEKVPVVKHAFIAECTTDMFIQFLQQTRESNKGIPFGVMIIYLNHAISIGFDGEKWLAADHDYYYYTENTDLLRTFLGRQSNRYKDEKMTVSMQIVTGNEHSLNINADALVVNAKKSMFTFQALRIAQWCGYANVITECITVIGQKIHDIEFFFELLTECKYNSGKPDFYVLMAHGYADAVTAFIKANAAMIAIVPLSEERKAGCIKLLCKLLISKTTDGTPGFCMALKRGHADAITAFIKESAAAMAGLCESEEESTRLIYGLFHNIINENKSNFVLALQEGGPAVEKAFAEGIDQLPLSAGQKETLKHPPVHSVENTAGVNQQA